MGKYRLLQLTDKNRIPELQELFRKGLGETTRKFWEWKYWEENGLPESFILVAEDDDKKIVGMFGFQLLNYIRGDESVILVQTQDLVIDPVCRGTGLMKILYAEAMSICKEKGAIAFLAYPNENSYPIFLKYGATDMKKIGAVNTSKNYLSNFRKPILKNKINNWVIEIKEQMPKKLLFDKNNEGYKLNKKYEFMKWKFEKNPTEYYKWLVINYNSDIKGYFVFQQNKGRIRTAVNICDFELDRDIPKNVLKKASRILKSYGTWVSIWGNFSEYNREVFDLMGFKKLERNKTNFTIHYLDSISKVHNLLVSRADLDY